MQPAVQGRLTAPAVTVKNEPRLDPNHVRAYSPGEAAIIEGGRVEHVRIIRNQATMSTMDRAQEIVAAAGLTRDPIEAAALKGAGATPSLEPSAES